MSGSSYIKVTTIMSDGTKHTTTVSAESDTGGGYFLNGESYIGGGLNGKTPVEVGDVVGNGGQVTGNVIDNLLGYGYSGTENPVTESLAPTSAAEKLNRFDSMTDRDKAAFIKKLLIDEEEDKENNGKIASRLSAAAIKIAETSGEGMVLGKWVFTPYEEIWIDRKAYIVIETGEGLLVYVGNTVVHKNGLVTGNLTDIILGLTGSIGDSPAERAKHVSYDHSGNSTGVEMNGFTMTFKLGGNYKGYTEVKKDGEFYKYINYWITDDKIQVTIQDMVELYNAGKRTSELKQHIVPTTIDERSVYYVSTTSSEDFAEYYLNLFTVQTAEYYISKTEHPEGTYGGEHVSWLANARNMTIGDGQDIYSQPYFVVNNGFDVLQSLFAAQAVGKLFAITNPYFKDEPIVPESNNSNGFNLSDSGNVPNANTKVVTVETKAPNAMKASNATQAWDDFLGPNQTNINPMTGQPSADRIFSANGTNSIRFSSHEMNSMGTPKGHFHFETWSYNPATDTMTINNVLQRIIP